MCRAMFGGHKFLLIGCSDGKETFSKYSETMMIRALAHEQIDGSPACPQFLSLQTPACTHAPLKWSKDQGIDAHPDSDDHHHDRHHLRCIVQITPGLQEVPQAQSEIQQLTRHQ